MGPTAKRNDYDFDFENILKKFYEMQAKKDEDYRVNAIRKEEELERLKSELEWIRIREYGLRENLRDNLRHDLDIRYLQQTMYKETKKENLLPDDLFEVK